MLTAREKELDEKFPYRKDLRERGGPVKNKTAYLFYRDVFIQEYVRSDPPPTHAELVFAVWDRRCKAKWKSLSAKEKKRFQDRAKEDKKRYDWEMKIFYKGQPGYQKKKKTPKDPNAPKGPISAFFAFCSIQRPLVRAKNPKSSNRLIAHELGWMWMSADKKYKNMFFQKAEKDKERFKREKAAYEKKKKKSPAKASPPKATDDDEETDEVSDEMDDE